MSMSRTIRSTVALAAAMIVLLATSASAVSPLPTEVEPAQQDCDTLDVTASAEADDMAAEVVAAVGSGEVTMRAPTSALDASQVVAYDIDSAEGTFTSATVPIGDEYSTTSNLTVLFDSGGSIVQYSETLLSANDAGNFQVTTYIDGDLASSQDTGLSFMTDAELQEEMSTPPLTTGGFDAETQSTAACVATVLGVSGAVAALIAWACAGSCALASIGIGVPFCVACIGAYATIGGASIAAVASCF